MHDHTTSQAPIVQTGDLRDHILARLLEEVGQFVSGTELSERTGVSRTAVWKHIQALQELGCHIESVPRAGHRLQAIPDLLLPAVVQSTLRWEPQIGHHVIWSPEVDSTNLQAAALAARGAAHGTVVTAQTQTGGKGRRGRVWFSPPTGLWFSIILRMPISIRRAADLTLLTSVAVRRVIVEKTGLPVTVKWPNDLLLHGRKICGILAEIRTDGELLQHAVVGVGINTNIPRAAFPLELLTYATSLQTEAGIQVSNVELAADIFRELDSLFTRLEQEGVGFEAVVDEWRNASSTLGQHVRIQTPRGMLTGRAVDIDATGVLYVQSDTGETVPVHSGDVLFPSE